MLIIIGGCNTDCVAGILGFADLIRGVFEPLVFSQVRAYRACTQHMDTSVFR